VTYTARSSTLFVAALPPGVSREAVEKLFEGESGLVACRPVRGMLFVDFRSEAHALVAMRKHQGEVLVEGGVGLLIDFDRDRNQGTAARRREAEREEQAQARLKDSLDSFFCMYCCTPAFYLAPLDNVRLAGMPTRSTDGATVVEEAVYLRHLELVPAPAPKLLRREKGMERQFMLCCRGCGLEVAYRPVPLETPTRYMYVLKDAVSWSQEYRLPVGRLEDEARKAGVAVAVAAAAAAAAVAAAAAAAAAPAAAAAGEGGEGGEGGASGAGSVEGTGVGGDTNAGPASALTGVAAGAAAEPMAGVKRRREEEEEEDDGGGDAQGAR
jgi:hypothetical protein